MRTLLAILLCFSLLTGCSAESQLDANLTQISQPHRFSVAGWHWQTYLEQAELWLKGSSETQTAAENETRLVYDYFTESARLRSLEAKQASAAESNKTSSPDTASEITLLREQLAALTPTVETIIQKQIQTTLTELGIFNPVSDHKFSFPPVYFRLEEMPAILIISPRDKIESFRKITLRQNLSLKTKENIEAQADALNVSSLVDRIGGMASYPSMIDNEASLRSVLETAAHEWAHHYLSFTPLGFLYVLDQMGISRNYDIATMNESAASIIGKEIGNIVFERYYSAYASVAKPAADSTFTTKMREIRKTVDSLLADGRVEEAEAFMEESRLELIQKGYYIRKLNQAYFTFHGTYADSPAFENEIGANLKALRSKSVSLKDFLDKVTPLTSAQALSEALK